MWASSSPPITASRVNTLSPVKNFDTVADMVAAASLSPGQMAITAGRYSASDGLGAIYEILAAGTGTADGSTLIDLTGVSGQARRLKEARATVDTAPAYVETWSQGPGSQSPGNLRTGLSETAMPGGGQEEELEIVCTGLAGSAVLTSSESAKISGLGSTPFSVALIPDSGQPFFATAISNNGASTITLLDPLGADFSGTLSAKYSSVLGQHLTRNATRAYAQHLANQTGLFCSRGAMMAGVWAGRDATYNDIWEKNSLLTAYGVQNSAAPIVQTSMQVDASPPNSEQTDGLVISPSALANQGVVTGTHAAGHGNTGTIYLAGADAIIDFYIGAYRSSTELSGVAISVVVDVDGVTVHESSQNHALKRILVPVHHAGVVTISVTNTDGGIYEILLSQLTVRKPGRGGKIIPPGAKVATLGDSWFSFYDGQFAKSLGDYTGALVDNYATGGMTTAWALAWFNTYIAGKGYDVVVLHFFTNDANNLAGQTFLDPDGAAVDLWPAGLTGDQVYDHWRDNMRQLISMIQSEGAKPVVILPGGTASVGQAQKHSNLQWWIDTPGPAAEWVTSSGEIDDATSFINLHGKKTGAAVVSGQGRKFATGPAAGDAWRDLANETIIAMQKTVLAKSSFDAGPVFTIGTDTDVDGLSDGVGYVAWGTNSTAGETYTPSIAGGFQRYASAFTASNTGGKRLKFTFATVAASEYIAVIKVSGAPANQLFDVLSDVTGGYTTLPAGMRAADAAGAGTLYVRETAAATGAANLLIAANRVNGSTITFDVEGVHLIDLAALAIAAPNIDTMTDAEIVDFYLGMN